MKLLRILMGSMLALGCVAASAQWLWVDKDGRKVFSDRAPPPDIQDKNILKRPTQRGASSAAPTGAPEANADAAPAAAAAPAGNAPAALPPGAGVDKDLEAKKKQAADAEAAKRKAEEEARTKAKVENCARAKQAKSTFDSGIRISRTNAAGEREVLDDAARAAELKRIQSIMDADCK